MARNWEQFSVYDIEIVTPTYCGTDSLMSLNYIGPSYSTGIEVFRATSTRLNVTHRTLMNTNVTTDCLTLLSNVQDVLARWYYAEKRKDSVPVIITPGCLELNYVNQLARGWDILLLTTVSIESTIRAYASAASTWISTSYYPSNCGDFYRQFLLRNNWTTISLILDIDTNGPPIYTTLAMTTANELKEQSFNLTIWTRQSQKSAEITAEIDAMLLTVRTFCRGKFQFSLKGCN
ncbi:hypothetical protein BV898_03423 [Hypsibius exemplaris]|uniref:Receptor ligand binding region domain-containing protein n=1 Tax=Hypsibius exemplaris TaxID=2072580 RepID=A0A1W0X598_HYPEX|nr:hypothetical protein BV898_03423 [Hypsibius exemplaris]